jgi:hypothetical protein
MNKFIEIINKLNNLHYNIINSVNSYDIDKDVK